MDVIPSGTVLRPQKPRSPQQSLLPISVTCVVKSVSDSKDDAVLKDVRVFCQEKRVLFETREYDSRSYRHDRDEIERLPAFHIFVNQRYEKTFYPNGRPFQIIFQTIEAYEESVQRRLARRSRMKALFQSFREKVKAFFHTKTRMEKYEEEQKVQQQKQPRRQGFFLPNQLPGVSWE